MALRRPYCLRGHKKGYIYTVGKYSGTDSYRKIKDPKFKNMGLVDTWIGACFLKKREDIKKNRHPCFDEGRMWCLPNDCSVFEAKQHYWKQNKEDSLRSANILIQNSNEILKILKSFSNCTPEDLLFRIEDLNRLQELLPSNSTFRQYLINRLIEEGDL